jgi:hypothetical protein
MIISQSPKMEDSLNLREEEGDVMEMKSSNSFESDILSKWENGVVSMEGFEYCQERSILWWLFVALSGGVLALVGYWRPDWELRLRKSKSSLSKCDAVLVTRDDGQLIVEIVHTTTIEVIRARTCTPNDADERWADDICCWLVKSSQRAALLIS